MRFRSALDLLDFDQALVAVTGRGPGCVNGASEAVHVNRIHPAAAQIGVVGNGQQFVTCLALRVHPFPQVLGMPRIERAVGHLGNLGAITEKDVAVQVDVVILRRVFVGTERRELAGMIVLVGNLDILCPD